MAAMADGYYSSKKLMIYVKTFVVRLSDNVIEYAGQLDKLRFYFELQQASHGALSMTRLRCILRGLDLKTYILLIVIVPTFFFGVYLHGQKISYFLRPLWESPPKPFIEIPHYYHEDVPMANLCRLHGWGIRESPRRVFDAVLFSENPFVEEAYQRVALDQLLKIAGIDDDDLLIMSDVDEIPSSHTINLLRWCDDIPPILHLRLRNYLYSFEFFLDNKSWRASVHRYQIGKTRYAHYRQTDYVLSDAGWHCSFCFRHISEFIFKMKAYSHCDRVRFSHYMNPKRVQDVICKGSDLFDMLPEEHTFKDIIGKLGPIPHSFSAVHLPAYLLNNAEKYGFLLPDGMLDPNRFYRILGGYVVALIQSIPYVQENLEAYSFVRELVTVRIVTLLLYRTSIPLPCRGSVSDFTRLQEGSGGGGGGVDCLVLHRPCPHIDMVMLVCQPFIKVTI
ncbi:hypothetical protein CK203_091727 [Vitis vinifera]|uniref:Beta-1,4-mannosyl-glycoprotein 4-beta-N-acetylglucosaminyltransferase n=1 Tax=Vitis vinifera TaxID=29760 RepID=A0A438D1V9_VITVI|nr:hypothetical protein CK203_091727 [Vitis vinifera]